MNDENKYFALEFTSRCVRLCYGFVLNNKVQLIDIIERDSLGLKEGMIQDLNAVTNTLNEIKKEFVSRNGINVDEVTLILPPMGLYYDKCENSFTVSNATVDKVDIRNVENVLHKSIKLSSDLKLIDDVVIDYVLDNERIFKILPLGEQASMLGVNTMVYALANSTLKPFEDVLFKAQIKIKNRIVNPLASSFYLALNSSHPKNYLLLNIGDQISNLVLINNSNQILYNNSYRFGSSYINENLKNKLFFDDEECEDYKLKFGLSENPKFKFNLKDSITLSLLSNEIKNVLDYYLEKIFQDIKALCEKTENSVEVCLIGGLANLKGIKSYFEEHQINCFIPEVKTLGARDVRYVALLGGISYASYKDTFFAKMNDSKNFEDIGIKRG